MEKPAIRQLLGEPHHIHTGRQSSTWYFERGGAVGQIDFDWEGRAVKVTGPTT